MDDNAYFLAIWFVGLCSGIALTLAWEARRITNETIKSERAALSANEDRP
jgi:hypothetical protein